MTKAFLLRVLIILAVFLLLPFSLKIYGQDPSNDSITTQIAPIDIVAALNAANITTVMSCCGHKEMDGVIILEDNRMLIVAQEEVEHND